MDIMMDNERLFRWNAENHCEYDERGLPATEEEAKAYLMFLFQSRSWLTDSTHYMEYAIRILKAYPSLAIHPFDIVRRAGIDEEGINWHLGMEDKCFVPPICHFFHAEAHLISSVLDINPDAACTKNEDGVIRNFNPLHVAFFRYPEEYKKRISPFLEQQPHIQPGHDRNIKWNLLYDFLDGIMMPQLREEITLSSVTEVADFLWGHLPEEEQRDICIQALHVIIANAVFFGFPPVVEYLTTKIPDSAFSKGRLTVGFDLLQLPMVRALETVLPKLKKLNVEGWSDQSSDNDTFVYLAQTLTRLNHMAPQIWLEMNLPAPVDRDATTAPALESMIRNNNSLVQLKLEGVASNEILQAVGNGMKQNQKIKFLKLHSIKESTMENVCNLLQSSPLKLDLHNASQSEPMDHHHALSESTKSRLNNSRLSNLTISPSLLCRFADCLCQLPKLKRLKVDGWRDGEMIIAENQKVAEALVKLAAVGRLTELDTNLNLKVDLVRLCEGLQDIQMNHLFDLKCPKQSYSKEETQAVLNLVKKNETVSFHFRGDRSEDLSPLALEAHYYSLLNKSFRSLLQHTVEANLFVAVLKLIVEEVHEIPDSGFVGLEDHAMKASVLFGLLSEQPSLWTSFALGNNYGTASKLISGGKRKRA